MKKFLSLFVLIFPLFVKANTTDIDLVYSLGLTIGGETLAERSDGLVLESGGLMYMSLGGVLEISSNFHLQANFGYHFDDMEASNGSFTFSRTFAELIPYYLLSPKTRLGVGVVNAFAPEYSDPSGSIGFDNAIGLVGEVNWQHSRKAWWGVRYVSMDFSVNNIDGFAIPDGPVIDGSYLGLMFHGGF